MSSASLDAVLTALGETQDSRRACQLLHKLADFGSAFAGNVRNPDRFVELLRQFVVFNDTKVRGCTLRVFRKFMKDKAFMRLMLSRYVHYFVARSLDRDESCMLERLEALKLVRRMVLLNPRCTGLPRIIPMSLVAIAEVQKDPLRRVCLDTICEIGLRNPEMVAHCNGVRLLLQAVLVRENQELLETIVMTLLHMLDGPETRCFFRPNLDLEVLFSVFTNTDAHDFEYQLAAARRVIGLFLKSWVGLFVMASDPCGLRSLVEAITLPSYDIKKCCLNTLYDIFQIEEGSALGGNISAVHIGSRRIFTGAMSEESLEEALPRSSPTVQQNLVNNFFAALLVAFMNADVIEALVELGKGSDEFLAEKAATLVGELLALADKVLPTSQCVKLHALPGLVQLAAQSSDPIVRARADKVLLTLTHMSRKKSAIATNRWSHIVQRVEDVKAKLDAKMDDVQFQTLIRESGVLDTKECTRWNWDTIAELLTGALNNPARLQECLRNEWARQLCRFYRPEKGLFVSLRSSEENINKYVTSGLKLFDLLLHLEEGKDFLVMSEIFSQFAVLLSPASLEQESSSLFSRQAIKTTLAGEYFSFVGSLVASPRGREVLEKARVFSALYQLTDMKNRDDLNMLLISTMTYATEPGNDHARILLSKLLTMGTREVRHHATCYLRVLLRLGAQDFSQWGVQLLVSQMYDPEPTIVEKALSILQEACDDQENLESLIAQKPMLLQMGAAGKYILLRFLTATSGFKYVKELAVLPSEILAWRDGGNAAYLGQLDDALVSALNRGVSLGRYKARSRTRASKVVMRPPHFYGGLACTRPGCALLRSSKLYPKFLQIVQNPSSLPNARRAMLWVVGNIGASELGAAFLHESRAIPIIVHLARNCGHLSVRGTCMEVIGLLSATDSLRVRLHELGWDTPRDSNLCICVANDSKNFFTLDGAAHKGSWAENAPDPVYLEDGASDLAKEILTQVSNLSNNVIIEAAAKSLRRFRTQHSECFADAALEFRVYKLLENFKFRLPTRRFIHDLFSLTNFSTETFAIWNRMESELQVSRGAQIEKLPTLEVISSGDDGEVCESVVFARPTTSSKQLAPIAAVHRRSSAAAPSRRPVSPVTVLRPKQPAT